MAKTEATLNLEKEIWKATRKQGVFGCFEVTIGWYGRERVDYITYDTKGIWRCYEIKVSKSDFNSKAKTTFVGNFNYYVMTKELYEQVKDCIPKGIGVYINGDCRKKATKNSLGADEKVLKDSLIRSLYRESEKLMRSRDYETIKKLEKQVKTEKKKVVELREKYYELRKERNQNERL